MYLDVHKYFSVFGRLNVITSIQSEAKKLNLYNKELNSRREKSAFDRKASKERITVPLCANATGCHQLPILIIAKNKHPGCFKHVNMSAVPVVYKNQTNAWVNSNIFVEGLKIFLYQRLKNVN